MAGRCSSSLIGPNSTPEPRRGSTNARPGAQMAAPLSASLFATPPFAWEEASPMSRRALPQRTRGEVSADAEPAPAMREKAEIRRASRTVRPCTAWQPRVGQMSPNGRPTRTQDQHASLQSQQGGEAHRLEGSIPSPPRSRRACILRVRLRPARSSRTKRHPSRCGAMPARTIAQRSRTSIRGRQSLGGGSVPRGLE